MSDFHTCSLVTGRKEHRCGQCGDKIAVGVEHRKCAQVWEGEFYSFREHVECHNAWNRLNFIVRDYPVYDGAPFLRDDDHEEDDRDWMREEYPLVAQRLGWSA
jgi:hypothetical protein